MYIAKTSLLEGVTDKEKDETVKDSLAIDVKGLVESGKNIYEDLGGSLGSLASNEKIKEVIPKELMDILKSKFGKS
jgi:hypothetical protein